MQFVVEYAYLPHSQEPMQQHRAAHLDYRMKLSSLRLAMQVQTAERAVSGSIVIIEAETLTEVETLAREDPYVAAGVFRVVSVRPVEVRFCNLKAGPP